MGFSHSEKHSPIPQPSTGTQWLHALFLAILDGFFKVSCVLVLVGLLALKKKKAEIPHQKESQKSKRRANSAKSKDPF